MLDGRQHLLTPHGVGLAHSVPVRANWAIVARIACQTKAREYILPPEASDARWILPDPTASYR